MHLISFGEWLALGEADTFDEAARSFGLGVGGGEIVPESFAVVRVADVGHFVGDDVIDHPTGPAANLVADTDMPVGDAAVGAASQDIVHITHPTDGLPLDMVLEICPVDVLGARFEIGVGAAFTSFGLFAELLADAFQQIGDIAFEVARRDAQQNRAVRLLLPAG